MTPGSRSRKPASAAPARVEVINFEFQRNLINILGEEHYPYGEFLYHELAANAWDSDASEVRITENVVQPARRGQSALYDIVVADNGNGMDFEGLQEYFRVGDSSKRQRKVSEAGERPLIGRIGVGKVSILKVARSWKISTERHLGLAEPVRLTVHVDVDQWIAGRLPAFAVQYVEPTGRPGTEITLEGVQTRLREDRILRHLQRLPLGSNFSVWRNGEFVPPRRWHGIDHIPIDTEASWEVDGVHHTGSITGGIWIRPEGSKRDQAYVAEPGTEKEGLERDPAGIEVRVSGDMIVREFFGREQHGHQVNRLWGWVEVPWLPILGNRTDYLRDSPQGRAFYATVKESFDQAYRKVRYEKDRREQERRRQRLDKNGDSVDTTDGDESAVGPGDGSRSLDATETSDALLASRYGEVINQILSDKPEFAPVLQQAPRTQRGRPAKDRIYPVRPAHRSAPFEADVYGDDLALVERVEKSNATVAIPGAVRRVTADKAPDLELGEVTINTTAGVQLRFAALGPLEAPYRWNLDDPGELTLDLNTDHKLYKEADRQGASMHRLHCAWLVSLALAERVHPTSGHAVADFLEALSYELYSGWGRRRRS
jgi:hypothetical protein